MPRPAPLTSDQIETALAALPGWTCVGGKLHRELRFPDFLRAFAFMTEVALHAEKLFDGDTYGVVLEGVFDATGEMSFELLRCDRFADFAIIHAIQKVVDEDEEETGVYVEAQIRATMWVSLSKGGGRIVAARFSRPPSPSHDGCLRGICTE